MRYLTVFRWLSVMLVVLVIAAAIGCGKKGAEEATPTPIATSSPTATAAAPAGQSGTLSDIEGEVQVLRSGTSAWSTATDGMQIWTGDGLKTGSNGYVLITFFDGSVMEVNAGTEISVEELSQTSGGSTTVQINQAIGNTLNRVQNLVDSSSTYEVTTPAGSAVVRGTIYSVEVKDEGKLTTCIKTKDERDTIEHSVAFSNGGGTVNVIENFFSCCTVGETPQTPAYSDPTNDPSTFESGGGGGEGQCAPGCYYSMVGNGICDYACLVEACNYDCLGEATQVYQQDSGYGVQLVTQFEIPCDCLKFPCPEILLEDICFDWCPYCDYSNGN